jgi:hypothetical protein
MVTLNDYNTDNIGFLGGESVGQAELIKAMQAGQITGRDTTGLPLTQEPLKVESLEKTLKVLEYRTQDIRLYNAMPKASAYNTVEEYLQLSSYGSQRGGFYNEGELSDVEDSVYIRRAQYVKYLQVTGEVTLQAQMVRSYVDAMAQEVKNKMMWVARLADKTLTSGDSDVIPQQFDGIYKQHAAVGSGSSFLYSTLDQYYKSGVVIDLRDKSLKQADIEDAAVKVDLNYGNVDSLFAPTTVISGVTKDYYQIQRILQNGQGFNGAIGTGQLKAISTSMGDVKLMSDKFMAKGAPKTTTTPSDSSKVPVAAASLSAALVNSDVASKFVTGDAGNVFYAVAAVNRFGESALTAYGTAVTLAAGKSVDLTITAGTGAIAADGYVVYRTKVTAASSPSGLDFFPLFKVSVSQVTAGFDGGSAGVVRDRGIFLPDTEEAFVTEMSDEVLIMKQLAPLSKLDLAILSPSRRFIVFQFLCTQLFAPKKLVRFINISKTYTSS